MKKKNYFKPEMVISGVLEQLSEGKALFLLENNPEFSTGHASKNKNISTPSADLQPKELIAELSRLYKHGHQGPIKEGDRFLLFMTDNQVKKAVFDPQATELAEQRIKQKLKTLKSRQDKSRFST